MTGNPYSGRPAPSLRAELRAEAIDRSAACLTFEIACEDGAWSWRVLDRATELEADGGCDSEAEAARKAEAARYRHAAEQVVRSEVFA